MLMSHFESFMSYAAGRGFLKMSLSERTRTGLQEMPSNAAWLLSRVLKPAEAVGTATESATAGVRDRRRRVSAAVIGNKSVVYFGFDSVDTAKRAVKALKGVDKGARR